jgi:hypothetical protein
MDFISFSTSIQNNNSIQAFRSTGELLEIPKIRMQSINGSAEILILN